MSLEEARERLPGEVLWGKLGLRGDDKVQGLSPGGGWVKVHAPGRDERTPSCQVWLDGEGHLGWKDYGSGAQGDEVSLIQLVLGLSNPGAIKYYCELAGVGSNPGAWKGKPVGKRKQVKKVEVPKVEKRTDFDERLRGVEVLEKEDRPKAEGLGELVKVYPYVDEWGEVLHETLRYEPKNFRQRRPDADRPGEWIWSLKDSRVVPFRLDRIGKAKKSEPIFLVEGEKDVEKLEELGPEVIATTVPMGSGKWKEEFARYFKDKWVVVIPDHDEAGMQGAKKIAAELFGVCHRVGVLFLDELWPGAKVGHDVANWFDWGTVEMELPVEEMRDRLNRLAECAGLAGLDVYDGCVYPGARGGMSVMEDRLARSLVKAENLIFCGDDFWQWRGDLGIWKLQREKTWIDRQVRRALRDQPRGEETITSNRVNSIRNLAKSERVVFPEALNSLPDGCFAVKNGVLNLDTGELMPHKAGYLASVQIPHNYDPEAECPQWLAWLEDRQEDEETRLQIQEIFGYCLATHINYHSFFFIYGDGGTGKSTCVDTLIDLVGGDNIKSVELTELDNAFERRSLVGKSVMLARELTTNSFKHIGIIKAIVSGDPISVDVKHGQGFDFRPSCRVLMESNVIAASPDSSGGFERRFIQVNFDKRIDRKKIEFGFQARFKEEMPGILNWALEGYQRLKKRGRFEHTARSERASKEFKNHRAQVESFLAAEWIVDHGADYEKVQPMKLEVVFDLYREWCEDEGVVAFYSEKGPFARELYTKRPGWKDRKRRMNFDTGRDMVFPGLECVRKVEV